MENFIGFNHFLLKPGVFWLYFSYEASWGFPSEFKTILKIPDLLFNIHIMMKKLRLFLICVAGCFTSFAQIPANTQPPSTYADSLFFANQWQPAKTAYREYLLKYPEAALPKLRIAFCQIRQNRPDEAINGLQQLTNMADLPANLLPMVQCRLAMAYSLKKNNTQAFEWLQKAQSNGYNNVYELEQDIAFANIQKDSRLKSLREAMLLASYPCMRDTAARAFDFWVGEWEVFSNSATRQRAGTSSIQNVSGGCLILENWTTWNGPYNGKSMNFYVPETGKWRQIWTDSGRNLSYFEDGEYKDGAMRFTTTTAQGQPGKLTFFNLGPNKVRQFYEVSADEGKTYQVGYDFIYVRKGSGEWP